MMVDAQCAPYNLEDVAVIRSGHGFPKRLQGNLTGEIPFFKVGNISRNWQKGKITLTKADHYISAEEASEIRAKTLPKGSVVFAKIGAAVALNRRAILGQESIVDNNVMALLPSQAADSTYIFYFMCNVDLGQHTRGGAVPSIRKGDVAMLPINLPTLIEQRQIVQRIESLFSRLDAGVASLQHAKAQLQRYHQSVLTAAVTGELTQAWRKANPDTEPASKLLKRILQQRREQWNGRGKYKEPALIRDITLNSPETWLTTNIDSCISAIEAGNNFTCEGRPPKKNETGLVKISAVTWGVFNEDESKTVTDENRIKEDYLIHSGDFLLSRANTLELVGAPVIVTKITKRLMLSDKVLRLKISQAQEKWLLLWLRSGLGRHEIESRATGNQLSMRNISQKNIREIPVPLPPNEEEQQIVAEAEARNSAIDHLEAELDKQLTRAIALRQSILENAFN